MSKTAPAPVPRTSHKIGMKAARTLYYAEEQAQRIGRPLNTSVTLLLSEMGLGLVEAGPTFRKLLNQRFSNWVRRPPKQKARYKSPPTWTYGLENKKGDHEIVCVDGPHNIHAHWTVHIPEARRDEFHSELDVWISEICGTRLWKEDIRRIRRINDPGEVARYAIKGAEEMVARHFRVPEKKISGQGVIVGRRTGATRNIGPTARRDLDKELRISRKSRMWNGQRAKASVSVVALP